MCIIDLHCDTILKLWEEKGAANLRRNLFSIDVDKLVNAGSLAQFFAIFIDRQAHAKPYSAFEAMAAVFYDELAKNNDRLALACSAADIENNRSNGKISCCLTIEEGGALEGSIDNLHAAYQLGVRLITLTWNYPNEIGYPNHEWRYQHDGLTPFGQDVICEMNRLGMLIDVSHLSDQGFFDVARLSKQPFIASHSNARAITGHSRNLTDDMIKTIANHGGVIGLNFCSDFLGVSEISRVEDMVRHALHIITVGGRDVIALGTDFDGINPQLEIEHIGQIGRLIRALEQAGLTENELEKFCWQNSLRVIRDVIG
jgi:membrane dipeptidase